LFGGQVVVRKDNYSDTPNPVAVAADDEAVRSLPIQLIEFQQHRNGFVHHDLATKDHVIGVWDCFRQCLQGLLKAFYSHTP
jgi:hypothetical protein